MFETFTSRLHMTAGTARASTEPNGTVKGLIDRFGGCTFDRGLYRVHDRVSSILASGWVNAAYPEFQGKLVCFGFDWLGRQFALDPSRGSEPDFEVIMLEPGTGEALEVPVAFSEFHTQGLGEYFDECLAPDFFAEWMATGKQDVKVTECVGYKVPLFLGGEDAVPNLESSDLEIYWSLMGDPRLATRHLSPGTSLSGMDIHDCPAPPQTGQG